MDLVHNCPEYSTTYLPISRVKQNHSNKILIKDLRFANKLLDVLIVDPGAGDILMIIKNISF